MTKHGDIRDTMTVPERYRGRLVENVRSGGSCRECARYTGPADGAGFCGYYLNERRADGKACPHGTRRSER